MGLLDDLFGNGAAGFSNGMVNGARAFANQEVYPGGATANQYVPQNWPGDGQHLFHATRPETFYTPSGFPVPPGGRDPYVGEMIDAPQASMPLAMREAILRLLQQRQQGR
jgi:hypothetical protein